IDVRYDDRGWVADRIFIRYLNHHVDERDGGVEVVIVIGVGPLTVYDRYRITGTLIARRVSVENVGEDELRLQGVRLALPWARVGAPETCRFDAPGTSVRPHVPLSVAAAQRLDVQPRRFFAPGLRDGRALERAPTQATGLLALHDPQTDEALLCWYFSTVESALPLVEGNDQSVTLAHEIAAADWLGSEVAITCGTQYIMLLREPWPAALAALQRTWPLCGLRRLEQPAVWVRDAAIFETHASQFGGFVGLTAALPELRALGMNTLCLLPIWDFANRAGGLWDGNWVASGNPYAIRDFDSLDPTLGTSEDLRALVATAHQHGMRVLVDLPLLGCADDARLVGEWPDWFCTTERGRIARVPDQEELVAFDWANADLQAYMLEWALAQVRDYDLDGYRLVAPRTEIPNWARAPHGHASASRLAVLRLIERLRQQLKSFKSDAALLGALSGPAYGAYQDFALDELPHHMFIHLALDRMLPVELGEWLEDHTHALPDGTVRVCFVESHQTRLFNPLADGLRGSRISRMLLAGMVLCGFVPLIRSGQEQDERAFIQRLLSARTSSPALRYGTSRYNALPCSSARVFAVLREYAGERLIGLLNVSAHKQTLMVSVPVDQLDLADGDYELYDLLGRVPWSEDTRRSWSRDELLSLRLTLAPFAAYCFEIRSVVVDLPDANATDAKLAVKLPAKSAPVEDEPVAALSLGEARGGAGNGRRLARRKRDNE
ncbi:MAG TPA: alpha-amylase family glycosyl hydrolase, partial [Roseiflexaceae bacterium]|nr:alpha-amylase family glycosyl hydrolase [Roseiflexaceae bacterium]